MAVEFELTDEMRAVVGVESEPWPVELTTTSIRAFARGVGYTDPRYYAADDEALPAPPCYLGTAVWVPGQSDPTFSGPRNSGPSVRHGLKGQIEDSTNAAHTFREQVIGYRL